MPSSWRWKRNDTNPIKGTLKGGDPLAAIDLAGATLRFLMFNDTKTTKIVDATANNDQVGDGSDGTKGKWSYNPVVADTDESGAYWGEVEVTFSGGVVQTFPTVGFFKIDIGDDLA